MSRIDACSKSIRELLQGHRYAIDEYQREYKWDEKNIEELLDDLHAKFSSNYEPNHERHEVEQYDGYVLGSIILSRRQGKDYIIDGQQRLTSLTLLLIYLHHLQQCIDVQEPINLEDLIFSTRFGRRSFNLDVPERVACLEALFSDQPYDEVNADESVRNMVARYDDIEEQFPESLKGQALPYCVDWLLEKVERVEISADSDDDAYTIFETMNDRGRPLSPTDMLKGYVLTNIVDSEERAAANRLWKQRIHDLIELGKEEESDFVKHWLRAKYAQTIRERKKGAVNLDFERIGTAFHKWVRDERQPVGLRTSADYKHFVQELYQRLCEVIWSPARLDQEVTVVTPITRHAGSTSIDRHENA